MKEYQVKLNISEERINKVIKFAYKFFSSKISFDNFENYLKEVTTWENSFFIVDEKDVLVGVYLIGDRQLPIKNEKYDNLIGVEGILLAIDKSIRGLGFAIRLKNSVHTLNVDYIWGKHFKFVEDYKKWLNEREFIAVINNAYITAEIF